MFHSQWAKAVIESNTEDGPEANASLRNAQQAHMPDENFQVINFKNPVLQARRGCSQQIALRAQMIKYSTFHATSLSESDTQFRLQGLKIINLNLQPALPSLGLRVSPSLCQLLSPARP
jgi:hypothetical protein